MFRRIIRRLLQPSDTAAVSTPAVERQPEPPQEPEAPEPDLEIDTEQLIAWLKDNPDLVLIDIREPHELQHGYAEGALLLRMNDIPNRLDALPPQETRLVIYCAAGSRSYGVTHWLREQGWTDTWSLTSGFSGAVKAGRAVIRPETA